MLRAAQPERERRDIDQRGSGRDLIGSELARLVSQQDHGLLP